MPFSSFAEEVENSEISESPVLSTEEGGSPAQYVVFPDSPVVVQVVPEEDYPVAPAYTGGVYYGTIGSTYLDFFQGVVLSNFPTNYVCFRQSQYVYRLYYGDDLSVNGYTFTGSNLKSITFDSRSGSGVVNRASGQSLNLNASDGFVYSNKGDFASFETVKIIEYQRVLSLCCLVLFGFAFLRLILFHK